MNSTSSSTSASVSCLSPAVKYFYDEALSNRNVDVEIHTINEDLTINFDQIIERVYSRDDFTDAEAVIAFLPLLKNIQKHRSLNMVG